MQANEWLPNGAEVRVCGWGNTSIIGDNFPAELHCVNTKIVSVDVCNERAHYNGAILKVKYSSEIIFNTKFFNTKLWLFLT